MIAKLQVSVNPSICGTKINIYCHLLGNTCCDSICTFDHECDFHEICENRKCIEDTTVEWQCSSGRYESPSMACKKVKRSSLEGMPL